MAVTRDDVRHVAELARLSIDDGRIENLVSELNGILGHMDVLSKVDTTPVEQSISVPMDSTPLRSDSSGPLPMMTPVSTFAPALRDGLFLVPRLASHEDSPDPAV